MNVITLRESDGESCPIIAVFSTEAKAIEYFRANYTPRSLGRLDDEEYYQKDYFLGVIPIDPQP
jgi:hypothetical protein